MDRKKSKSVSAYSKEDRKHIVQQIEKLTDKKHYTKIFTILMEDDANTYTQNSNGVFLNLSVVSDNTMCKIEKYLNKIEKNRKKTQEIILDDDIIPSSIGCKSDDRVYRLSNYEKNIIKQKNISKSNDEESEYEEFKIIYDKPKRKNKKKELEK